jgi:hypothetical protein
VKLAARLVLLAGAAGVGLFLFRSNPREVTLVYGALPHGVRELDVEVVRGGEILRRAELHPYGASEASHRVRLPDGEYVLRLRLAAEGEPRRLERPLSVTESGTVVIPLGP